MTTTILSSKGRFKNLLVGMLRKNIPFAIYLSAVFFLLFPLQTILDTSHMAVLVKEAFLNPTTLTEMAFGIYTGVSMVSVIGIIIVATFIIGLVQCSYLHSKRAVDLYHSLPVTRTELMSANMLTGFLTVMVPFLLNYIINLCAAFYRNGILGSLATPLSAYAIFWDLFGWCVTVFSILSVIMLVSTQVGSIFENFIFAGELLAAPPIIILIIELLCREFLVGFISLVNTKYMAASSPVPLMAGLYSELIGQDPTSHFFVTATVVWLFIGIAVFLAALALGRRRKSEIAECPGCKGILGTVLTLAAVYIGGIAVGSALYSIFDASGEGIFILNILIGSVLVFILVAAVLNRGFGGMSKKLPFGALCCAFTVAATFAITSGGLGYETRIPAPDKVESVTFDYRGWYSYVSELDASTKVDYAQKYGERAPRYSYQELRQVTLTTPEAIGLMEQIHLSLVADEKNDRIDYFSDNKMIQYKLKNGTQARQYRGYSTETNVLLLQLAELPEFQEQTNPVLRIKSDTIQSISLMDSLGFTKYELSISREMGTLLEALRSDARANGVRDFTANSPVLGYIYFNTGGAYADDRNLTENLITNFSVPVFASSTNTIAALNSMGREDALGAPDPAPVTEAGLSRYSNYRAGDIQVAGIGSFEARKENHDYTVTDKDDIRQIVGKGIRFSVNREGYSNYSYEHVYFTLYRGEEQGITLMLSPDDLPESVKQLFPEIMDRYEEYIAVRETDKTLTFVY